VHARAAQTDAGQERAEPADRQRALALAVAQRPRLHRRVLEQLAADRVAQLVVVVGEVLGAARVAALQTEHRHARLRQLRREDPASPADADRDRVDRSVALDRRHQCMPSMPFGSTSQRTSQLSKTV
jgi:hypothetical protein